MAQTKAPPPARPVFGEKPPEKCAKCAYPISNKSRFHVDKETGLLVCNALYACETRATFLRQVSAPPNV